MKGNILLLILRDVSFMFQWVKCSHLLQVKRLFLSGVVKTRMIRRFWIGRCVLTTHVVFLTTWDWLTLGLTINDLWTVLCNSATLIRQILGLTRDQLWTWLRVSLMTTPILSLNSISWTAWFMFGIKPVWQNLLKNQPTLSTVLNSMRMLFLILTSPPFA